MYIFKCSNRVLLCCVSIIYTFKHFFFVSLRCNVLHLLIHHHILVYFRTLQLWVSWKKRLCLWWVDRWYFVKLSTVFSLPRSQYTLSCFFVNSISYPIKLYIHYFYSFAFYRIRDDTKSYNFIGFSRNWRLCMTHINECIPMKSILV